MKKKLYFLLLLLFPNLIFGQHLKDIKNNGKIHVAFTKNDLESINYKLALEFAKFLNVELIPYTIDWKGSFTEEKELSKDSQTSQDLSYVMDALKKADLIGSLVPISDQGKKFCKFAGQLEQSNLLVIPEQSANFKSYNELKGKTIAFSVRGSYKENIVSINNLVGQGIKVKQAKTEKEAIEMVINGNADGFVTNAFNALKLIKSSVDFKIAFPVSPIKNVGWATQKEDKELAEEIDIFFETIKGTGKLDEIFIGHYGTNYATYTEILHSYGKFGNLAINQRDLDEILESGKLVVALRERLMVYDKKEKQFNHYIAEEFAKYLGVGLEIKITPYFAKYFEDKNGKNIKDSAYTPEWFNSFDVACEIMVPQEWRLKKMNIVPFISYAQVVIGRKDVDIFSLNDLKKHHGVTSKGSAQEDILTKNNINNYYYTVGDKLLENIDKGLADYSIGTDAIFRIADFDNVEAKFVSGQVGKFGWAIKKDQPKLMQKILEFLEYAKKEGILDKYFKKQTGMTLKAAENYLTVLQETYQPGVFPFVFYGTKEGLPQEDILSIFQDKDNYIWMGTHSGAVRYNGREMKVFDKQNGLSNNSVFDIAQDSNGAIYFATLRGVTKLENDKLSTLFSKKSFRGVFIDKENNKWFYGDNGICILKDNLSKVILDERKGFPRSVSAITQGKEGLFYIASKEGLFVTQKGFNARKISNEPCYFVITDAENRLWVSGQGGLYLNKENHENNSLGIKMNEQLNIPKNTIIRKIKQSDIGLWFMSNTKIFQLITLKQKPIVYDENIGLMGQRVLSFLEDGEANIWIGYAGGVQKLTNKSLRLLYPKKINNYVNSIVEDETGRMWLGLSKKVYSLKEQLHDFTNELDGNSRSFVVANLTNGNVVIANTLGLYELDVAKMKLVDKKIFEKPLQYIEKITVSSKDEVFLLTGSNGIVYYINDFKAEPITFSNESTALIHQLVEFEGKIIGGNNSSLVYFNGNTFETLLKTENVIWSLCPDGEKLWVGTDKGLTYYKEGKLVHVDVKLPNQLITAIEPENRSHLWLGTNEGFVYYNKIENKVELHVDAKDGLQGNEIAVDGLYVDKKGILWVGTYHGISTYDIHKRKRKKQVPGAIVEKILLNGKLVNAQSLSQGLSSNENNLVFEIAGLSFKDEESVEYEFFMKGLKNDYVASQGKQFKAQYLNLPPGKYEFTYRTKGKDGIWGYYKTIAFEIDKPFYAEWWFIIFAIAVLFFGFFGIQRWRNMALRHKNAELERIVKLRTSEIQDKNEELQEQNEEIITQRDQINAQHNEIKDSIYYAKRIQSAVLPRKEYIEEVLPESFILFRPRDIVSGDFYWIKQIGKYKVVVAADCTGHGVPGSIMSMLGVSFINEIVLKREIIQADLVLNELRLQIKEALRQTSEVDEIFDGMDMALCVLDTETFNLQYAGAANPLYYVQDGELKTVKADRMPIGHYPKEKDFTLHNIQMKKGDIFYIFSDGYVDQFGKGEDKFKAKNFRKVLFENHSKPMAEQKEILEKVLDEWKEGYDQTDDIIVVGVKV